MQPLQMRSVELSDRDYVETLLAESDLPTDDLDSAYPSLYVFEVADDGESVGVGGLEVAERVGLLRSVAVEPRVRGRGYGTAICERLLRGARAADLEAVFLLTTTAAEFFADLGFETVERDRAPEAVRETAQFTDLCPDSATCMRKAPR